MSSDPRTLDTLASTLINHYQGGIPVCDTPYAEIAHKVDCSEAQVINKFGQLLDEGWLTRLGPLYDAAALGGGLTLAAVSAPENYFDNMTDIINRHPQVAHNYRREHKLNMWFVIATQDPEEVIRTISSIEEQTGLEVFNFPKQREFYVGLWLNIRDGDVDTVPVPVTATTSVPYFPQRIDNAIIHHTQSGLPLAPRPWDIVAKAARCDTRTVLNRVQHMLDAGVIRRIGAVPNHYRLGLRANGMSVWDVDDDMIDTLGRVVGDFDFVSHCYQRPRHLPQWRYNLFAMLHGRDRDEVNEKSTHIARVLGQHCTAHDVLYSSAILKKTGMRLAA